MEARLVKRLRVVAALFATIVTLVGIGHLLAWMSGYMVRHSLTAIIMTTNAALGLTVSGIAVLLTLARPTHSIAAAFGIFTSLLGASTLFENLTGADLKIDQFLATAPQNALGTFGANRMGIPASSSLVFAGLSILLFTRRPARAAGIAQWFALLVALISSFSSIGYLYGVWSFYAITRLTAIAWTTAFSLLLLSFALLFSHPDRGWVQQFTSSDPGGAALRRWPPVLLLPLILGYLRLEGERADLFDAPAGTALFVIVTMVSLLFVAYQNSIAVSRSAAALIDREERLRLSNEAARIGAFDWDLLTEMTQWTPEVESIHGLAAGTAPKTRQGWESLLHPDDRSATLDHLGQALHDDNIVEGEWRVVWPDSSVHWIAARWRVFRDSSGKPLRMVGVNMEVTERKRMQQALEDTVRDLERSNRELEQFAYICAHDLQEPLREVRLFVQLLQTRCAEKFDSTAAEYFSFVSRGAARMSALITGVLEYSRAGLAQVPSETQRCEVLLECAIESLATSIQETQALITHDALPSVTGDRTQLIQLFQNLIGNAVKFRREGVQPRVHIACKPLADAWQFEVADNGIGIPEQFHEKVFRIFQRLHGSDRYRGTGIGLAICRKIVETHNGRIWIRSNADQGSTFCFTLPRNSGG